MLTDLRKFVSLDDNSFVLLLSWLLACYRPRGPYPIAVVQSEHGSAKTTTERVSQRLVDPSAADVRAKPKDLHDLAIAANNSWQLMLDNISGVPGWLSDAFCRLATGGGFATRELYTHEEKIFTACRPLMLTGITEFATHSDFLDRAIRFHLLPISPSKRKEERVFWAEFNAAAPQIIGCLLDAVSWALREYPTVELTELPRMADFARWAAAAMPSFGYTKKTFIDAYAENRSNLNAIALEASVITKHIMDIADSPWSGTATDLLAELNRRASDDEKHRKEWPGSPKGLRAALDRIVTNLRAEGFFVVCKKGKERLITIDKIQSSDDGE